MDSATVSDHFNPWRHNGGHSPFSLALDDRRRRTDRADHAGHLGADPTFRYNPAVIARRSPPWPASTRAGVPPGWAGERSTDRHRIPGQVARSSERFARLRCPAQLMRELWGEGGSTAKRRDLPHSGSASDVSPAAGCRSASPPGGVAVATSAGRAGAVHLRLPAGRRALHREAGAGRRREVRLAAGRDGHRRDESRSRDLHRRRLPGRAGERPVPGPALSLTPEQKHGVADPIEMERLADETSIDQVAWRWITVTGDPDGRWPGWPTTSGTGLNHVFPRPGFRSAPVPGVVRA